MAKGTLRVGTVVRGGTHRNRLCSVFDLQAGGGYFRRDVLVLAAPTVKDMNHEAANSTPATGQGLSVSTLVDVHTTWPSPTSSSIQAGCHA